MKIVLEKIKYEKHKWQICGNFKVLRMLLTQQSDNMKYPCLIKQFVKALNKEGQCFQYIMTQFPQLYDAKLTH